jgi:hypothetical protein
VNELIEYRRRLMDRLVEAGNDFCTACEARPAAAPLEGDWTLHQIAAHVRDVDRFVYGARVLRTLQEENPLFENFDADDWMAEHYNKTEPLKDILSDFKSNLGDRCTLLGEIPQEAWSRVCRHETMGEGFTLQLWVERCLAHIEEHLLVVGKSK